jgi:hypothetical protein
MTTRTLTAMAGIALLAPTLALAEVQVVNGEAGMIFKDEPSTLTREQVRAAINVRDDVGNHWSYIGGEAGWAHNETRYVFDGGTLIHASDCPVLASMNAPVFQGGPSAPLPVYSGA